jgi:hypothetical protein
VSDIKTIEANVARLLNELNGIDPDAEYETYRSRFGELLSAERALRVAREREAVRRLGVIEAMDSNISRALRRQLLGLQATAPGQVLDWLYVVNKLAAAGVPVRMASAAAETYVSTGSLAAPPPTDAGEAEQTRHVEALLDAHNLHEGSGGSTECTCGWPNRAGDTATEHEVLHIWRAHLDIRAAARRSET